MNSAMDLKTPGQRIQVLLHQQGKTIVWLADQLGISTNSVGKIIRDPSLRSKYVPDCANILGVSISSLYGEDINDILREQPEYTLDDAPVCVSPYRLGLFDELDFLPRNSVVRITPLTEESKRKAIFWLFRPAQAERAQILRSVLSSDQISLVDTRVASLSRQRIHEYIPDEDGIVLGVVQDVASCEFEFWRP